MLKRLNLSAFKRACREVREELDFLVEWRAIDGELIYPNGSRQALRAELGDRRKTFKLYEPTEEETRITFSVAAGRAQQYGASDNQVRYLASLVFAAGDAPEPLLDSGMLTKRHASFLISEYTAGQ